MHALVSVSLSARDHEARAIERALRLLGALGRRSCNDGIRAIVLLYIRVRVCVTYRSRVGNKETLADRKSVV